MRLPAFSKIFNQKIMTGIDIQPEGVQLVQLCHNNLTVELCKVTTLALEAGIFAADGKIIDWDRLTAILFDWVRELDVVGAVTAAAMPAHAVRLLRFDEQVTSELQVRNRLELALPGLGEAVAMDYVPIQKQNATLVAVTKRDYLDAFVACLTEAGLVVKIMEVEQLAIMRAMRYSPDALLWQQRGKFKLVWQDEKQLPQLLQFPASYGEQAISELTQHLEQQNIKELLFCGSTYYGDLFKAHQLPCDIHYFSPAFNSNGINMPDYLLAIGLAMREVPRW